MEPQREFRHILRVINTDLDGNKPILQALRKIKGISFMLSNAVLVLADVNKNTKAGYLSDSDLQKVEDVLKNPSKYSIPKWMLNRRKDYETGKDVHLLASDLTYQNENDLKRLKKIKSYRGIRHMLGQPVRGQRTKSNFRKNKGKVQGVQRKKEAPASSPKKEGGKK